MDLKSQPMAGPMKKPLHPPVALAGFVAFFLKEFHHLVVHFAALNCITKVFESQFLPSFHGMVKASQSLAGAPLHDGSCYVSEVPRALRTWEHINNDWFVGPQLAVALLVR